MSFFFCYLRRHVLKIATPFESLCLIRVQILSATEIYSAFLQLSQDIFAIMACYMFTFQLQRL